MSIQERYRRPLAFAKLIAAVIILPILLPDKYVVTMMFFVAIYGVLSISLGLLVGYAGLFSLAQPTWFGLGAYIAGVLAARGIVPGSLGIVIAAVFVALVSYLLGLGVLRLKGHYLACATICVLIIGEIAFIQLSDITGGHSGLLDVPRLSLLGFAFKTDIHYYFLAWALCIACLCFFSNILCSRVGRAVKSSRDSDLASSAMGINIAKYRIQVFVLTSVASSLAGSILCFYLRFASPSIFSFSLLVQLILMIVVGGGGTLGGYLLGSFLIVWLGELLSVGLGKFLPVMTGEVQSIFFGLLIILFVIFLPDGLSRLPGKWFFLVKKVVGYLSITGKGLRLGQNGKGRSDS